MVIQHSSHSGASRRILGLSFLLLASLLLLFSGLGWAQPVAIPKLDNWIVDTTGTFSAAQKNTLAQRLKAFEENKGAQIMVLMVPTSGEDGIDLYTRRVYDQWQLGRKNVDDGVLLVVAKDERRLRIEVGYGLEGAVTDLQSGRIIREFIAPHFVKNDYVGGVNEGVTRLMNLVAGEDLPPPPQGHANQGEEKDLLGMLLPLALFALVLPPLAAAFLVGLFSFFLFGSLPLAAVIAVLAFVLSLIGKLFGVGSKRNLARASRRGARLGGIGGFGGRRRGGGFGGGGFGGGGGGRSGGGGASGGW